MAFNKLTVFIADKTNQIINFYNQKIEKLVTNEVFVGDITISGAKVKIASTFCKDRVDDVAAELLTTHQADIAILVNSNNNEVQFRKRSKCKVNLGSLANKLCGGSGSTKIASGKITESFLNFTKLLQKA